MRVTPRGTSWLLLLGFFLSGCGSSHQRTLNRLIEEDGGSTISNIESVTLPPAGMLAYVLLYPVGAHASRVQVVAFRKEKPIILFESGSGTPNTDFRIEQGVPTIILEQSDYNPDYVTGKRSREFYAWNGATFTHTRTAPVPQCEKDGYVMDCP